MVLADDSFGTIVTAIVEGRTIYENMKKFIYFIFSSNIGELFVIFSGIVMGLPPFLTAVFILIINTLTDVFPALALGVEPMERSILESPPRAPEAKIMNRSFISKCILAGIWIGGVTTATFIANLVYHGWRIGDGLDMDSYLYRQSATMAFVVLTLLQMVQALNSKSETISFFKMKFLQNIPLLGAVAFSLLMTVALVQIPFFHKYIKTTSLSATQWAVLAAVCVSMLFFEEIRKWRFAQKNRSARISS
jgi:Ca2+-transporting ATPase